MISAILLIVFIWQFYIGYARGIVLQTYYLVASVLSLVIAGQFGNGEERNEKLRKAGYNPTEIQTCVNELYPILNKYGG